MFFFEDLQKVSRRSKVKMWGEAIEDDGIFSWKDVK